MITSLLSLFGAAGESCSLHGGSFLGFPTWYEYLDGKLDAQGKCLPSVAGINDVWVIVAAIIDILLHIAALLAVGIIIYGGVLYMTSQGDPDKTSRAKSTIVNALVGLAISVMAAFIISYIAGKIT